MEIRFYKENQNIHWFAALCLVLKALVFVSSKHFVMGKEVSQNDKESN